MNIEYRIAVKIFEITNGRKNRREDLEPQLLWPYNYKWDVGRSGSVNPNKKFVHKQN